jgi:hypothetical protein
MPHYTGKEVMDRMKRKTAAMVCLLMMTALLTGCADRNPQQTVPPTESTHAPAVQTLPPMEIPEETTAESTAAPETEPQPIPVETPYGTLYYQPQWEGLLLTEQTMTDDVLCVTFLTRIGEQEYQLFRISIGVPEANAGTICDREGNRRNVQVSMEELGDLSALTDDQKNMLYALQEEINFVIDKLT